eukprot:jgi/Psemu1/242350/estExt_Genewise1.C_2810029
MDVKCSLLWFPFPGEKFIPILGTRSSTNETICSLMSEVIPSYFCYCNGRYITSILRVQGNSDNDC